MENYQRVARQRQIDFHEREAREGPNRKPPMPEVQVDMHRRQLALHLGLQATDGMCEVIPFPIKEKPEDLIA